MRFIPLLVVATAACSSSSSSNNLTCAYLVGDNCYKVTASAATSCLPASTEMGAFSADHSTCTYASGDVVTFTPALTLPLPSQPMWNFTVATSTGAQCLSYKKNSDNGFTLTVQGQTITESIGGASEVTLACPDGMDYSSSNPLGLLSCGGDAGASFGDVPGDSWGSSGNNVEFSLLSTSSTSSSALTVFNCQ